MTSKLSQTRGKINPRQIQKSYMERIEEELSTQGVRPFDVDNHLSINERVLDLPPEITEIPSKDLGELLNAYTQQKVYYRTILGRCELVLEEKKREYFSVTKTQYQRMSYEKLSETAKDRILNSKEDVEPFYYAYMDASYKVSLVKKSIESIEDIIFMLSRELTRRAGDMFDENRRFSP